MAKIKIIGEPKQPSYSGGGSAGPNTGDQQNYGLWTNATIKINPNDYQKTPGADDVRTTYPQVDKERANIEIEKGEYVIAPDLSTIYNAGGRKHSQGGTPIQAQEGSYVVSDYIKANPAIASALGFDNIKPKHTWADVLSKNIDPKTYNAYAAILDDKDKGRTVDPYSYNTAKLSLPNYQDIVSKVALGNELSKAVSGKPYQIPGVAQPGMQDLQTPAPTVNDNPMFKAKWGGIIPSKQVGGKVTDSLLNNWYDKNINKEVNNKFIYPQQQPNYVPLDQYLKQPIDFKKLGIVPQSPNSQGSIPFLNNQYNPNIPYTTDIHNTILNRPSINPGIFGNFPIDKNTNTGPGFYNGRIATNKPSPQNSNGYRPTGRPSPYTNMSVTPQVTGKFNIPTKFGVDTTPSLHEWDTDLTPIQTQGYTGSAPSYINSSTIQSRVPDYQQNKKQPIDFSSNGQKLNKLQPNAFDQMALLDAIGAPIHTRYPWAAKPQAAYMEGVYDNPNYYPIQAQQRTRMDMMNQISNPNIARAVGSYQPDQINGIEQETARSRGNNMQSYMGIQSANNQIYNTLAGQTAQINTGLYDNTVRTQDQRDIAQRLKQNDVRGAGQNMVNNLMRMNYMQSMSPQFNVSGSFWNNISFNGEGRSLTDNSMTPSAMMNSQYGPDPNPSNNPYGFKPSNWNEYIEGEKLAEQARYRQQTLMFRNSNNLNNNAYNPLFNSVLNMGAYQGMGQ